MAPTEPTSTPEEDQPTALEIRQYTLQMLKLELASKHGGPGEGTGNLWTLLSAIHWIEWEISHMYDDETGEYLGDEAIIAMPEMPAPISPAEVWDLQGNFEYEGVLLTARRGPMGGHGIVNRLATAQVCRDNPGEMVSRYGGSERAYRMLAHILDQQPWHYPPLTNVPDPMNMRDDFTVPVPPGAPYTDEEIQLWVDNYSFFNFHGANALGRSRAKKGAVSSFRMLTGVGYPRVPVNQRVKLYGYRIHIVPNHPEYVMEELRELYNTNLFLDRYYRTACNLLYQIDSGTAPRQPGYRAPDQVGGTFSEEWYRRAGERESGDNWPDFF